MGLCICIYISIYVYIETYVNGYNVHIHIGHFFVMPDKPGNFTTTANLNPHAMKRYEAFAGGRSPMFYTDALQQV
jgi:hypothetical protein